MRKPEMRNLERLRHWQGEKLKRADFADQAAYDARRAAWHNRSLHETFGIVAGLQVSIAAGKVSVTPGLAYDAQGNPLWLARATEMHLPTDVADRTYYLVLGVPRGCGCRCPESGAGFEWAPESEWMSCDGLPLAVTTADGALSPCEPRRIRALERPRLASGETIRGRTPWELWEVSAPGQTAKIQAGVQTRIDTSSSGFTTTPHYFASLRAPVAQDAVPRSQRHRSWRAPWCGARGALRRAAIMLLLLLSRLLRMRSGLGRGTLGVALWSLGTVPFLSRLFMGQTSRDLEHYMLSANALLTSSFEALAT